MRSSISVVFVAFCAALAAVVAVPVGVAAQDPPTCNGLVATIVGTEGDDTLQGTWQDDVIVGLGGNDTINGASGSDTICGGDGDDTINGESQSDWISGGPGGDTITGADGDDVVFGGDGNDVISTESGNDIVNGNDGDDNINGGSGDDDLDGGNGFDIVDGLWNNDVCDDAEIAPNCETVTSNGEDGTNPGGGDGEPGDPVLCDGLIVTIVGTDGDDVLTGTFANDVIAGLGGNDVINGASGEDTICGGPGDDTIAGDSQADRLFGEEGDDTITGADGDDYLDGGPGNDTISGDSQNDFIHGRDGDDDLSGGSGDDDIDGGNGIDTIDGLWQTDTCDDGETVVNCETETQNGEDDDPVDPPSPDGEELGSSVDPNLICVADNTDGTSDIFFGYTAIDGVVEDGLVTRRFGDLNRIEPAAVADKATDWSETFLEGTIDDIFGFGALVVEAVDFQTTPEVSWVLDGTIVTATATSPSCPKPATAVTLALERSADGSVYNVTVTGTGLGASGFLILDLGPFGERITSAPGAATLIETFDTIGLPDGPYGIDAYAVTGEDDPQPSFDNALIDIDNRTDIDDDGLPGSIEFELGTDPNRADSDSDGLRDGFEFAAALNPLQEDSDSDGTLDGGEDLDGDTLSNLDEQSAGTSPISSDTDVDGLDDAVELFESLTDPLTADTDGDGLFDVTETEVGLDPNDEDSDNDGILDSDETTARTTVFDNGKVSVTGTGNLTVVPRPAASDPIFDPAPGDLGPIIDLTLLDGELESAELTFDIDVNPGAEVGIVRWYPEYNLWLPAQHFEDQAFNPAAGTITATIPGFSSYKPVLLDFFRQQVATDACVATSQPTGSEAAVIENWLFDDYEMGGSTWSGGALWLIGRTTDGSGGTFVTRIENGAVTANVGIPGPLSADTLRLSQLIVPTSDGGVAALSRGDFSNGNSTTVRKFNPNGTPAWIVPVADFSTSILADASTNEIFVLEPPRGGFASPLVPPSLLVLDEVDGSTLASVELSIDSGASSVFDFSALLRRDSIITTGFYFTPGVGSEPIAAEFDRDDYSIIRTVTNSFGSDLLADISDESLIAATAFDFDGFLFTEYVNLDPVTLASVNSNPTPNDRDFSVDGHPGKPTVLASGEAWFPLIRSPDDGFGFVVVSADGSEARSVLSTDESASSFFGRTAVSQAAEVSPNNIQFVSTGIGPGTADGGAGPDGAYFWTVDTVAAGDELVIATGFADDADGDGLADCIERAGWKAGSLDQQPDFELEDTDDDGLLDGEEVRLLRLTQIAPAIAGYSVADLAEDLGVPSDADVRVLQPIANVNEEDGDEDLTDPEEVDAGTNPFIQDSDFDGVIDSIELADEFRNPLVDENIDTIGALGLLRLDPVEVFGDGSDLSLAEDCLAVDGLFFVTEATSRADYGFIEAGTCLRASGSPCPAGDGCEPGTVEFRRYAQSIAQIGLDSSLEICDELAGECVVVLGQLDDSSRNQLATSGLPEVSASLGLVLERGQVRELLDKPRLVPARPGVGPTMRRGGRAVVLVGLAVATFKAGQWLIDTSNEETLREFGEIEETAALITTIVIQRVDEQLNANGQPLLTVDEREEIELFIARECRERRNRDRCVDIRAGSVAIYVPGGTATSRTGPPRSMGAQSIHINNVLTGTRLVPNTQRYFPAFLQLVDPDLRPPRIRRDPTIQTTPRCSPAPGEDLDRELENCDEYPYNRTKPVLLPGTPHAAAAAGIYLPSTQLAPSRESSPQGIELRRFISECEVTKPAGVFFVVPLPERVLALFGEVNLEERSYTPSGGSEIPFREQPGIFGVPSFGVRFQDGLPEVCMPPVLPGLIPTGVDE